MPGDLIERLLLGVHHGVSDKRAICFRLLSSDKCTVCRPYRVPTSSRGADIICPIAPSVCQDLARSVRGVRVRGDTRVRASGARILNRCVLAWREDWTDVVFGRGSDG